MHHDSTSMSDDDSWSQLDQALGSAGEVFDGVRVCTVTAAALSNPANRGKLSANEQRVILLVSAGFYRNIQNRIHPDNKTKTELRQPGFCQLTLEKRPETVDQCFSNFLSSIDTNQSGGSQISPGTFVGEEGSLL